MIFGIGTDIVEVARIEDTLARFGDEFAARILNAREFEEYSRSKTRPRFLAKRFAAKEAFAKALGTGIRGHASFANIAVAHDALGKPIFELAPALLELLATKNIVNQHLSVSDEKNLAAAFVVLETS